MKDMSGFCSQCILWLLLISTAFLSGCRPTPKEAESTSADWNGFVSRFLESYFEAHPDVAVDQGRHEFDGRLPDWGPGAFSQEIGRLRQEREIARAFAPVSLSEAEQFEREYLVAQKTEREADTIDVSWLKDYTEKD